MPTIAFLFCLLGEAAFPSPLRIDIVFQGVKLSSQLKAAALEEATRIWATYDVELHESSAAEARRDGALRLSVAVADRPSPRVAADALGSIYFVNGSPTALILLYPNTIAALVPTAILSG